MGVATESLYAARKIEGVNSREITLSLIAEALAKAEMVMEARGQRQEMAAARENKDAYSDAKGLAFNCQSASESGDGEGGACGGGWMRIRRSRDRRCELPRAGTGPTAEAQARAGMAKEAIATARRSKVGDRTQSP